MRVLITGHEGYIGAVMAPMFRDEGIDVVGLDSGLFLECDFGDQPSGIPGIRKDLRDVTAADLEGFDAVIHLAAISNDPLGNLNPDCTYAINHRASVHLAKCAKEAGVGRWRIAHCRKGVDERIPPQCRGNCSSISAWFVR